MQGTSYDLEREEMTAMQGTSYDLKREEKEERVAKDKQMIRELEEDIWHLLDEERELQDAQEQGHEEDFDSERAMKEAQLAKGFR